MAGRHALYLWVVLATTAVVFTAAPTDGGGRLQGQHGSAYDQRPEMELMANTKSKEQTKPKKKRDYSNHPWKKYWPDFRTTPRTTLVDWKNDRNYDSFAADKSDEESSTPYDIRMQKGGIGNKSYTWTPNPRQPPRHPWQRTWPDTRPYHFEDPGPQKPKKDKEETTKKEDKKKGDKNKNGNKKKKPKKKKSFVSAFLGPQLAHNVGSKKLKAIQTLDVNKPTLVDLKQRVRRAATAETEAPRSLDAKGPKKLLNGVQGWLQQQLNRLQPSSATSPNPSTVRVAFGQPVQSTTLKPNDMTFRKVSVETTTHDRSIITAPLKACPDGQRMGPNRNCVANYTDPEDSD